MKVTAALISCALLLFGGVAHAQNTSDPSDTEILNYALTLEYLESAFYSGALRKFNSNSFKKAGYPAFVYERVKALAAQEASHAAFLAGALGDAATKPCTYKFPYNTVQEFLALSRVLEGVGVSAYLGAAADIDVPAYLTAAGSILTVEARHQAVISEIQGASGFPSAYDTPLDYSQVFSLAAPFIKSCPSSNPALPVTAFPALTLSAIGKRNRVQTSFTATKPGPYYAHLLNGLQDIVVPLNADKSFTFPSSGLSGSVYVTISTNAGAGTLNDSNTVTGTGLIVLPAPGDKMAKKPCKKDDKKHHRE